MSKSKKPDQVHITTIQNSIRKNAEKFSITNNVVVLIAYQLFFSCSIPKHHFKADIKLSYSLKTNWKEKRKLREEEEKEREEFQEINMGGEKNMLHHTEDQQIDEQQDY